MKFESLKKLVASMLRHTESTFETEAMYQNYIDAEIRRRQSPIWDKLAEVREAERQLTAEINASSNVSDEVFAERVDRLSQIVDESCRLNMRLGSVENQVYKDLGLR